MNWKLDNISFSDYGVHVQSVSGAYDFPKLDIPTMNWLDENGKRFSPFSEDIRKKDQLIILRCWMKGTDYSDFKTKATAFFAVLKGAGQRQLSSDLLPQPVVVSMQSGVNMEREVTFSHSLQLGSFNLKLLRLGDPTTKTRQVFSSIGVIRVTLDIGDDFRLVKRLQGDNYISGSVVLNRISAIRKMDYIETERGLYFLFQEPEVQKESTNKYVHSFRFEHEFFKLRNVRFRKYGSSEIYDWTDMDGFIDDLLLNLDRIYPNLFIKGTVDSTIHKNIHISNCDCLSALKQVTELFNLEYGYSYILVAGKIAINVKKRIGNDLGISLRYNSANGIYKIKRESIRSDELATVVYAEGSTRNLPLGYREMRLQMPQATGGKLSANTGLHGVIEHCVFFDDIFPQRTGIVSAYEEILNKTEEEIEQFIITDSGINFDINSFLVPNVHAKVTFQTGSLAGFTFDIKRYDHQTRQFWIIPFVDEHGNKFPRAGYQPAPGNEYIFVDIYLPQEYVDLAEQRLQAEAQYYLDEHKNPKITYGIELDPFYIRNLRNTTSFRDIAEGDEITVSDPDFGIASQKFRVAEVSMVLNTFSYSLILSEARVVTKKEILQNSIEKIEKAIDSTKQDDVNTKRRNTETVKDLEIKILNPSDMKINPPIIRDESISPRMLSYDSIMPQLSIRNAFIETNVNGNPNRVAMDSGELLMHNFGALERWEIKNLKDNLQPYKPERSWDIPAVSLELPTENAHFVYAKVDLKSGSRNVDIEFSEQHKEIKLDIDNDILTYKLGQVSAVKSGRRDAGMLFGNTKSASIISDRQPRSNQQALTAGNARVDFLHPFKAGENYILHISTLNGSLTVASKLLSNDETGFNVEVRTNCTLSYTATLIY